MTLVLGEGMDSGHAIGESQYGGVRMGREEVAPHSVCGCVRLSLPSFLLWAWY